MCIRDRRTIKAISESPLRYGTCVEPIGIEHSSEELADKILENLSYKPYSMGCMARVNVPGTPFEGYEPVSKERMLHILATMRLCVGTKVRSCSIHQMCIRDRSLSATSKAQIPINVFLYYLQTSNKCYSRPVYLES